jgi:hypothetical protein
LTLHVFRGLEVFKEGDCLSVEGDKLNQIHRYQGGYVVEDQRVWEIKLQEICVDKRAFYAKFVKVEEIWTVGSRRTYGGDPCTSE